MTGFVFDYGGLRCLVVLIHDDLLYVFAGL